ncbi:hypothetical protein [Nocardia wallacei]|uniref:ESX-1 secretion-associated protein n=1 Tax=Nocardia wallacei TaxID=480035 RepID=A0A7G1KF19_9NOCA|nr:hypothetical protein [Nocardia wallacei]BCK53156.1 hypothetical protein NWFMUON74_09280 [Nocardia wallacei]
MVSIDTAAVQGIATDLAVSGQSVLTSAKTLGTAAAQVDPAQTGQMYHEFGAKLSQACVDAAGLLARWGSSIEDCTNALRWALTVYERQEQANTAGVGAAGDVLV